MPQPTRLYSKGVVLGYRRSRMIQDTNTSLVKIEGVTKKEDTEVGDARLLLWRGVHEERR